MPNGTAHTATSSTTHFGAPRWRSRASVIAQAATIPSRMKIAYARSGSGPMFQTAWVGLGIAARGWAVRVTGTTYRFEDRTQEADAREPLAHRRAWAASRPAGDHH